MYVNDLKKILIIDNYIDESVSKRLEENIRQFSNGETGLEYYNISFESGNLYILDEPENSLAPKFQIELSKIILECARYCNCQFIIASHSPFTLSIEKALVYDLDKVPVNSKKWYDLENMRTYYEFFSKFNENFKEKI